MVRLLKSLCLLVVVSGATGAAGPPVTRADVCLRGADVSSLPRVEAGGGVFREGGAPCDALALLRARGLDTVRIRLWHAPVDGSGGLPEALALAERATAAGFGVLLDFHYADTWADPGHQPVPAAWTGLALPVLTDSVRCYTRDVLVAFAARGVVPQCVQFGNEITAGMLWDQGRVGGAWGTSAAWDRLAALLEAAGTGLDEALPTGPRPAVMIHIDRGGDNAGARRFLDNLVARRVGFDLIGLSYYPWWHGGLQALADNLTDLAARYGKGVAVVETAYPWTLAWFDATHNQVGMPTQLLPEFPATPAGQAAFAAAVLAIVRAVPDGLGAGVFWWEPAWIAAPAYGSPWENLTLFADDGSPLPALDALGAGAR